MHLVSTTETMFEAAISKFVKTVGEESLLAVPNLDQANSCRPFQVVVKKNRRWYWQSPKYEPTPFQLHQLLTNPQPLNPEVKVSSRKLTNYNKKYNFSLDGKIGGKLKTLLDVELSGVDTVSIDAQFGDITKEEADQPKLMKVLESSQLDIKHEFLDQVQQDSRKVLCIIVGVAKTTKDCNIHMKTDRKGEEKLDAEGILKKVVDPEEDAKVDDANEKTLLIPKDTPLAYNVCELYVKADGALELVIEKGVRGGFEDRGEPDADEVDALVEREYSNLEDDYRALYELPREDRNRLNSHVLSLCKRPLDVQSTFMMLKHASRAKEGGSEKLEDVKQIDDIKYILDQAGLEVKDDLQVTFPENKSEVFNALLCWFEALMELDDDETIALSACNGTYDKELLELFTNALEGTSLKTTDSEIADLYQSPNPQQVFVQTLGFQISDGNKVTAAEDNTREIEGALRAVYALWWDPSKPKKASWKCNIL